MHPLGEIVGRSERRAGFSKALTFYGVVRPEE